MRLVRKSRGFFPPLFSPCRNKYARASANVPVIVLLIKSIICSWLLFANVQTESERAVIEQTKEWRKQRIREIKRHFRIVQFKTNKQTHLHNPSKKAGALPVFFAGIQLQLYRQKRGKKKRQHSVQKPQQTVLYQTERVSGRCVFIESRPDALCYCPRTTHWHTLTAQRLH